MSTIRDFPRAKWLLLLLGVVTAALGFAAPAQAQHRVTVWVVSVEDRVGVPDAVVRLDSVASDMTNAQGTAVLNNVPTGTYTVTVERFGFLTERRSVAVGGDTTFTVLVRADPFQLDTLMAVSRRVNVRGTVTDAETGWAVPRPDVIGGGTQVRGDATGGFVLNNVPTGDVTITVRGLGYLPRELRFELASDTTLEVVLDEDPVAQAMIQEQRERLDSRIHAAPVRLRVLDRADIMTHRGGSVYEMMHVRGINPHLVPCLIVDDWPQAYPEVLKNMLPEDIERIEIIDNGWMVRLYTFDYVRRQLREVPNLLPFVRGMCQ